jgi:hypothetical protein
MDWNINYVSLVPTLSYPVSFLFPNEIPNGLFTDSFLYTHIARTYPTHTLYIVPAYVCGLHVVYIACQATQRGVPGAVDEEPRVHIGGPLVRRYPQTRVLAAASMTPKSC